MAFDVARSARLRGNRLDLSIEDRSGKVQNFYAIETDIVDAMKAAMRKCGQRTQAIAFELCPKDTWFMANHLHLVETELTFEVGWWAAEFFDAGFDFYPVFVVLGTRFQAPNDPLTPAFEQTKPEYAAEMREQIDEALRRRAVGGRR